MKFLDIRVTVKITLTRRGGDLDEKKICQKARFALYSIKSREKERPEIKFRPLLSNMDIFDLLNNSKNSPFFSYFLGQTKESLLIGPSISKKTCVDCFIARLKSSSFVDPKVYLPISRKRIELMLKRANSLDLENKMIELDKKTGNIVLTHYLICIPGCRKIEWVDM